MRQQCFEADGVTFFLDAPRINPNTVQALYDLWDRGNDCYSEPLAVGHIALRPSEQAVLQRLPDVPETEYGPLAPSNILRRRFRRIQRALLSVVARDISAHPGLTFSLAGRAHVRIRGGYYHGSIHALPPHSHDDSEASVCWVVAHGAGAVSGIRGGVRKDHLIDYGLDKGKLDPRLPIGPSAPLKPVLFEPGTVVRGLTSDLVADEPGNGSRIVHEATLWLHRQPEIDLSGGGIIEAL